MIKLGILGSSNGTDLKFIINAIDSGKLNAEISVVISNLEKAYILTRAHNCNIPGFLISHKDKKREDFDNQITDVLKKHSVDLILLIGFMRILSADFCQEWYRKILNVHPSLLPKYAGGIDKNVHKQVIKNGDSETGCTIHYVNDKIDGGPILLQKKCDVHPDDTIDTLKSKVQRLEGEAFIEAIILAQKKSVKKTI